MIKYSNKSQILTNKNKLNKNQQIKNNSSKYKYLKKSQYLIIEIKLIKSIKLKILI